MSNVSVSNEEKTSILRVLKGGLIVSCQAPKDTPIDTPEFIAAQAQTVCMAGAAGIRAEGIENISAITKNIDVPIIGLVKRYLSDSPVYITPFIEDIINLARAGSHIIAIDATERLRPENTNLSKFLSEIRKITDGYILADVDTVEAGIIAEGNGCDIVATTLSGYTEKSSKELPDIELVGKLSSKLKIPVLAEGGYIKPNQVKQAFEMGAWSVCIGTAITNPYILTKNFLNEIS